MSTDTERFVTHSDPSHRLKRYCLGDVSEEERAAIEADILANEDLHDELLALQGELSDRYVRGDLPEYDRARIEAQAMASAAWRERIAFSSALLTTTTRAHREKREQRSSLPSTPPALLQPATLGLTAGLIVVLIGLAWLGYERQSLRREVAHAVAEQTPARIEMDRLRASIADLEARQQPPTSAPPGQDRDITLRPPESTVAVTLFPGGLRGSDSLTRLVLPPIAATLEIIANLDEARHTRYDATLRTAEGAEILVMRGLRATQTPDGPALRLLAPTDPLTAGDYVLIVVGDEKGQPARVAEYTVRIVRP